MVPWYKTYRVNHDRKNPFIIDLRFDGEFDPSIFDDPLKETISAINFITNNFPPPYSLMCSGGVDSQAMVYAWYKSKVPFSIYHWSYNGENSHETESLARFIGYHDMFDLLTIKNFNAREFITSNNELREYAKKYDTTSPQMITLIKVVEQTPGTVIMAGNFTTPANSGFDYTVHSLERYAQQDNPKFIPFFFQITPRLSYAFYLKALTDLSLEPGTIYDRKCKIYQTSGFDLIIPELKKQTGFEKIKELCDSHEVSFIDRLKTMSRPSKRPFDILYRYKLFEVVLPYNDSTSIIHHPYIQSLTENHHLNKLNK